MSTTVPQQHSFQPIVTERLRIRQFTRDDLAALSAIRNDPAVQRYQSWSALDEGTLRDFVEAMANAEPGIPGEWFQFAIALRSTDELVGDCGLHLLKEDPRQAEIGYTLSSSMQGQGLAQEAVRAILDHAFATFKLHRISAITDVRNQGSIRLLERLHFRREGKTHQAFWNKGEWVDEYLYAMTNNRWMMLAPLRATTPQSAPQSATKTGQPAPTKTTVVLLGTGTPNADPERHGSALAVVVQKKGAQEQGVQEQGAQKKIEDNPLDKHDEERQSQAYLVDAGPGLVRRAADAARRGMDALAMPRLTRLFLTHHHSDHTAGLPDLILSPWVLGRNEPLVIYGPKGTAAMVEHLLAAYAEDIRERREGLELANDQGYRVNVHEYEAGEIYQDAFVTVEAFRVQHGSWPAFGLRFTTPDRTVVVSGDTRPFDGLAAHYQNCDLLVHEVYSAVAFQRRPPAWQQYHAAVHTSTTALAALANQVRPGLLVLVHQLFWGEPEDALLDEIRAQYDGPVISGHDLDLF